MDVTRRILVVTILALCISSPAIADWPAPVAPVVPEADGYVAIPHAAHTPSAKTIYRAVYNATLGAGDPARLIPALNMAGSQLNALAAEHIPLSHAKFVVVFHGDALVGILDDAHYRERFGVPNPNLKALSEMKAAGVEFFACGQNLAADNIDPASVSRDVTVASGALIVLMDYENDGYALMNF